MGQKYIYNSFTCPPNHHRRGPLAMPSNALLTHVDRFAAPVGGGRFRLSIDLCIEQYWYSWY